MAKKTKGSAVAPEPFRLRNSERGTMDKCPQRWWWDWRDGLTPKETAKPLWFGTGIHMALAHYYKPGTKRGKDMIDVWREFTKDEVDAIKVKGVEVNDDVWIDAVKLGEAMLTGYMQEYEGDKHWDVISTEQTFELKLPYDFSGLHPVIAEQLLKEYGEFFFLNGTFDGVYRDKIDKRVKLMEHKTAASISVGHLPVDNQAGTYWMVAGLVGVEQGWLKPKEQIREVMYNFLRKGLPDERPKDDKGYATNKPGKDAFVLALEADGHKFDTNTRGNIVIPTVAVMEEIAAKRSLTVLGERSKVQPAALFERHPVKRTQSQRKMQLSRIQAEVTRMLMIKSGMVPLTKSAGKDTCGFCSFRDMCELHESGGDWEGYRDMMFRTEDKYADHRKSAAS